MKAFFTEAYEFSPHFNFVGLFCKDRMFVKYYVTEKGDFLLELLSVRASSDRWDNETIYCQLLCLRMFLSDFSAGPAHL